MRRIFGRMGNNATKESRSASQAEPRPAGETSTGTPSPSPSTSRHRPGASTVQPAASNDAGRRRSSNRHDMSLFRMGSATPHEPDPADPSARRETRAEREARKREKERELRAMERQRSMKEESIDGGYLVTLGTYTGPEDFSKTIVRHLMVERRLAPFWRGLQDHDASWTDGQFVALAKGEELPEPAASTPSPELLGGTSSQERTCNHGSNLMVPAQTSGDRPRSPSNPEHASSNLFGSPPSSFRSRARTLVSLGANKSQSDMTPTETHLPQEPHVNGQLLEAFLYRPASECPICFLYYPPYLNKTRCCDQPICSECFVQIKRPDPHPPEHHDDPGNPSSGPAPEAEYELVSEVATCPFCKQPEFGVTYDAPPFRRGIVYQESHSGRVANVMSAMSSSSSVNSQSPSTGTGNRRRATSLAADAQNVVSTDLVRPDWRKKLDDARAHALRRAAAATALHNAAYVLGNQADGGPRLAFGRRRRTFFGEGSGGGSAPTGDTLGHMGAFLATADRGGAQASDVQAGASDIFPGRGSSRRSRMEDLEELMYMEAIRLSLASAEEERRKQEKEDAKKAKKDEKQKAKDAKKAAKDAKRAGSAGMYSASTNGSQGSGLTGNGGESSSAMGRVRSSSGAGSGKGKAPVSGTPSPEPPSTTAPRENPQAFLEQSRANIQSAPVPILNPTPGSTHLSTTPPPTQGQSQPSTRTGRRHVSRASSVSSLNDSNDTSPNASGLNLSQPASPPTQGPYAETPPSTEPMFNFRSLAAVIGTEDDAQGAKAGSPMIEHLESVTPSPQPSPGESSSLPRTEAFVPPERPLSAGERLFGVTSAFAPPLQDVAAGLGFGKPGPDKGGRLPLVRQESNQYDAKHYGDIGVLDASFGSAR